MLYIANFAMAGRPACSATLTCNTCDNCWAFWLHRICIGRNLVMQVWATIIRVNYSHNPPIHTKFHGRLTSNAIAVFNIIWGDSQFNGDQSGCMATKLVLPSNRMGLHRIEKETTKYKKGQRKNSQT